MRLGTRICCGAVAVLAGVQLGCRATVQEVRGKTSFGPEFRNRGDNTSEIRYDARQGVEVRWDNGITTGLTYRRRDIDNGSGDNENLFLFEVGYPIWRAPKKEDALAARVAELEKQVRELRGTESIRPKADAGG